MNNQLLTLTTSIITALKTVDTSQKLVFKDFNEVLYKQAQKDLNITTDLPECLWAGGKENKGINSAISAAFSAGQAEGSTHETREKCRQALIERLELGLKHGKPLCLYASDIKEFDVKTTTGGTAKSKHDFDAMINALTVLSNKDFTTPEGLELTPLDLAKKTDKPYLMARTFFEDAKQGLTAKEWNDIYAELIEDVILSRVNGHESAEYQAIDNALRLIDHIKRNAAKAVEIAKQDKIAALKAKLKRA